MKVNALKSLFRSYADETDTSFLSDADVQQYLELGYNRFRKLVNSVDELRYSTYTDIAVSGSSHDLNGVLLGSAVQYPMQHLVSVERVYSGKASQPFSPVSRQADLYTYGKKSSGSTPRYIIIGRTVHFDRDISATVRFTYIPYQSVDWTTDSYIDDLVEFHDLIPMLGYYNYAIRDGVPNQVLTMAMAERKSEMREYLMEGLSKEHGSAIFDSPDWL